MTPGERRPDVAAVMRGLRDFQRATVEYVFSRMYTDQDLTQRFLIADEVGLGKTLVARGLIAKAIDHLWDRVDRIDVVYICSNADIARQNINRLNVTERSDFALASRITMLPLQYHELGNRKLNFISFTPGTSFDLKSSLGMSQERVLLYRILQEGWGLRGSAPLNVLQGNAYAENFRRQVEDSEAWEIDEMLSKAFLTALEAHDSATRARAEPDLRTRFDALCSAFSRSDSRVSDEIWTERISWVGELRSLLAQTCLTQLQPDLVILDEFQRFRHLLRENDEASQLAQQLFRYADDQSSARVLLLSATPYKMYTLQTEGEDHYRDFLDTLRFLLDDPGQSATIDALLSAYRRALLRAGDTPLELIVSSRSELESALRQVMVRTERLSVTTNRKGMLREVEDNPSLERGDVLSYLTLDGVAAELGQQSPVEYWKSAPYLLNFMEGYDLKRSFEDVAEDDAGTQGLGERLASNPTILLPWRKSIEKYRPVDPNNPRLRVLNAQTLADGAWRLLWIPPSLPYYALAKPFSKALDSGFSKRLVFSSWRVVPRAISSLLSYEAERLMITSFEPGAVNTAEERERRRPLLRFARADGRLSGLPLLSLIYPCSTLASIFDPLGTVEDLIKGDHAPEPRDLINLIAPRILTLLQSLHSWKKAEGPTDERWYWTAPILMDLARERATTRAWWGQENLVEGWSPYEEGSIGGDEPTAWADHVAEAREVALRPGEGGLRLGSPPADLPEFLAYLALGGPGTVVLRALSRLPVQDGAEAKMAVRNSAARVARAFLALFNQPEATNMIRSMNPEEPYWRRTLEYCVGGCLQSVMDEYVHLLRDSLGLIGEIRSSSVAQIAEAIEGALLLRTSTPGVDEIRVGPRSHRVVIQPQRIRNRFAQRFGDERVEGSGEPTRSDQVRSAFNSPFWPFVLATTSVGQEGLDFHSYCHIVVHWNLPSNPVDLEQREGRVHRYKGHAVRKNLAKKFGLQETLSAMGDDPDPWNALFRLGVARRDEPNDVVPFWVFATEGGAHIERHIPVLPLSRDVERAEALRRSLAVYRMVFGQPSQEDLVAYLLATVPNEKVGTTSEAMRIDLSPPNR